MIKAGDWLTTHEGCSFEIIEIMEQTAFIRFDKQSKKFRVSLKMITEGRIRNPYNELTGAGMISRFKELDVDFPKLMINKKDKGSGFFIILANQGKEDTIQGAVVAVKDYSKSSVIGYFSKTWTAADFEDYSGSVELNNGFRND